MFDYFWLKNIQPMNQDFNFQLALLLLRLVTGILFFFQAYDKIFIIKLDGVMNAFGDSFNKKNISRSLIRPAVAASSYTELICGALLIFGFQRDLALIFLAVDMFFVALIFSIIKPMWDMQHYFPRFVFIITLLLLPKEFDTFTIDQMLK